MLCQQVFSHKLHNAGSIVQIRDSTRPHRQYIRKIRRRLITLKRRLDQFQTMLEASLMEGTYYGVHGPVSTMVPTCGAKIIKSVRFILPSLLKSALGSYSPKKK